MLGGHGVLRFRRVSKPNQYTPYPYTLSSPRKQALQRPCRGGREYCYTARMTLIEITFDLQSVLVPDQLRTLGAFANTYGLRRFRVDEKNKRLSFEYDASRLNQSEVAHVLRQANIPVLRRVEPMPMVSQI